MDGTYTRTLPDGTVFRFDASGRETSVADRNNLRVTYSYDGSGKLTSILDPYGKTTSLAYDPVTNLLLSVSDPANRVTTFVHLGTNLSSVVLPDTAVWLYGYDTSKRLTSLTDPRLKMLTVTYDGAGRVSGTSRPDGSSEAFTAYQERGWVAAGSGTSGSPAAATLLAEDSRDLNAHLWAVAPANPSRRPHQHRVSQYSLFLTASNTARRMVQMGAMDHGAGEKEYTQGRRNGRLTLFRLAGVTISTLVVVTNPCSGLDSDGSGAEN